MIVAHFKLARRTHHAEGFNASDFRFGERHVDARHVSTDRRVGDLDPGAGIWRTTDDLHLAVLGRNLTYTQLVRIRMLFG